MADAADATAAPAPEQQASETAAPESSETTASAADTTAAPAAADAAKKDVEGTGEAAPAAVGGVTDADAHLALKADWTPSNDEIGDFPPATDEELEKAAQLWEAVKDVEALPPSYRWNLWRWRTLFMVKFLMARNWDVEAAAKMYRACAEFKLSHKLESTPLFPSPMSVRGYDEGALGEFQGLGPRDLADPKNKTNFYGRHIAGCTENGWHKTDKAGRPILIERLEPITADLVHRCQALVPPGAPPSDCALDLHLHANEVGAVLMRHINSQRPPERHVSQVSVIFDCTGLGMRHLWDPLLQLLKRNSTVDKRYFPEGLHRAYICNAPTLVTAFWAVIKLWLEPRQIEKVKFFKPHQTLDGLKEYFEEEDIPAFLGGKCDCPGGCVRPVADLASIPLPPDATREATVANRTSVVITADWVPVPAGAKVGWQYHVPEYQCGLKIRFKPADAADDWDGEWDDQGKTASASGVVEAGAAAGGVLQLQLDNGYSMLRSKRVLYRVYLPDEPTHLCGGPDNLFGCEAEDPPAEDTKKKDKK